MQVQKFNISKPRKYTDRQGQERTQWNQIGVITKFIKDDGTSSMIIEIPAIGLEANIFPFEKKSEGSAQGTTTAPAPVEPPEGEINAQDIPF